MKSVGCFMPWIITITLYKRRHADLCEIGSESCGHMSRNELILSFLIIAQSLGHLMFLLFGDKLTILKNCDELNAIMNIVDENGQKLVHHKPDCRMSYYRL